MLLGEFNFDDDVFVGSEKDKCPKQTRSVRRERCYQHARAKRACEGGLDLNLGKEELWRLQKENPLIQELRKSRPDRVVEQAGLLYHLWMKKWHTVEQLLLPNQYHQTVCNLSHSIPIAGNLWT